MTFRRGPNKAQAKQAWMAEFSREAVKCGGPSGRLDWDTAHHLFFQGIPAKVAAHSVYCKTCSDGGQCSEVSR